MSTTSVNPDQQVVDDPIADMLVKSNMSPASIRAVSNLAEDTIFASGCMDDLADGPGTLVMFRNPFNGGAEEVLFVDNTANLWHVWKTDATNPPLTYGTPAGWAVARVAGAVTGVCVAMHPDGSVYAFTTTSTTPGGGSPGPLGLWNLHQGNDSVPYWMDEQVDGLAADSKPNRLFLQYLDDRPATAVVFAVEPLVTKEATALVLVPRVRREGVAWEYLWNVLVHEDDVAGLGAIGVDSTYVDRGEDYRVNTARLYSTHANGSLWRTVFVHSSGLYERTQIDTGWTSVAGVWTSPNGAGCVGYDVLNHLRTSQPYPEGTDAGGALNRDIPLDRGLMNLEVWQDAASLLHVYGRAGSGGISVFHQLGWVWDSTYGVAEPAWEMHWEEGELPRGTTRGLFASVKRYAVDAYPDDMPNQLALHDDVPKGEALAIYTQQIGTSYWERETVRVVPSIAVAPYTLPRYQTKVTVVNGYGAPVPGCAVTLTSDGPVDLEVSGTFYRTGASRPISLMTDLAGSMTLRIVADGLSVPNLHLSVPGVAQALTVQPSAEVHKYFAGAGPLPNLPEGFTAKTVGEAKNWDGTPLFPHIRGAGDAGLWPPSAAEVVGWCAGAFAVSAKTDLPTALTAGLAEGETVLAFSLQTHDPSRPGVQVYTSQQQLDARRALLVERGQGQGLLDEASEWFGDLVEGLRAGVITVSEVAVDVAANTLKVLVNLADGAQFWLTGVWDDVVSAAHAVEAIFAALGAEISQVIDYLMWPFGMGDIWDTKKVLQAMGDRMIPGMITMLDTARQLGGGTWFADHKQAVVDSVDAAKTALTGRTLADVITPSLSEGMQPPTSALAWDHVGDPHTGWLTDLVMRNRTQPNQDPPPSDGAADDPFQDLIDSLTGSPDWPAAFTALENTGELFTNLFDFSNAQTLYTRQYTSLLDIYEKGMLACLDLGDSALDAVVTAAQGMLRLMGEKLAAPIDDPFVQLIYDYVQTAAGVPDDEREPATVGGFGALYAAFPTTVIAKLVLGHAPFPGGTVPDIPPFAPPGESTDPAAQLTMHEAAAAGESVKPPWWEFRFATQVIQGVMMAYDAGFDSVVNGSMYHPGFTYPKEIAPSQEFWVGNAITHVYGYAVGDWPWLWGGPTWPRFADSTYLQFGSWMGSIIVNVADFFCAADNKRALAMFEDEAGVGPSVYSFFGLLRIAISVARYNNTGVQSATDWLNMWINVTSFESSASGIVRWVVKKKPQYMPVMHVKAILDIGCDAFAGGVTTYQSVYTLAKLPKLTAVTPPPPMPVVGVPYDELWFAASGGWAPYTFSLDPGEKPPAGLELDPNTGRLHGTAVDSGPWVGWLTVMDYSGPSFGWKMLWKLTVQPSA